MNLVFAIQSTITSTPIWTCWRQKEGEISAAINSYSCFQVNAFVTPIFFLFIFFYVERLCSSKSFCVPSFVLGLFYCHINSKHTHTTEFLLRPCCSLKNFRAILQMQTCALEMAKGPRLQHAAKVLVENGLKMRNHISEEMGDGAKPHVTVIVKCQ